ncbi:hypothetical protein ACIQOV_26340 [Kitasatospora sp. NPDC091257]|uniref:hypothetical protein n=1 Tax=Kitasatospora sp. NPDC091257 TaxID=3364084 RepID=UPI00382AAF37
MAAPSAAAVARAEEAREQLKVRGLDAWVEKRWWGFEVHMNKATADEATEIEGLLADIVNAAIPPLGQVIAFCMKPHAAAIKWANTGQWGVKCSSPWIAPSWLVPSARNGPRVDFNMWWTVLDGSHWSNDEKFPGHESAANPALAVLNGRLVTVHRAGVDNSLWYATYAPETGWSEDIRTNMHSADGPALATFNGKIHLVYRAGNSNDLMHGTFDDTDWTVGPMPFHQSSRGPALAVYGGALHLVHRGGNSDRMWHATYDGSQWSPDTEMPRHETASNPALCEYNGALHLVHRGGGNDTSLWHAAYDGSSWSQDFRLPGHNSLEGPALAAYNGKMALVHRGYGSGDQNLWGAAFVANKGWEPDVRFPNHLSSAGPALIVYRDKNGEADQLLCVHRGAGKKAAGTDTAEVEARLTAERLATDWIDTPQDTP